MPGARGSEWHRWDPHLHTPGTLQADQYPTADGWERYLQALESSLPVIRAIGVTDYCVTRSYERVKAAREEQGRLTDCLLLFPNVELRLNTGTVKGNFVNIHLLVSPDDPNHVFELNRFLGRLVFSGFSDKFACTPEDLRRLGRLAGGPALDDEAALRRGAGQFKVSLDNLLESYRDMAWAQDNILIAVSANADGTSGVKEAGDATLREEIEKAGHLMFASSAKQRDFWLGRSKASPAELLERYGGLKPCIWGSDAHELARVGKPDEDRFCWIKGVPAFDTLRQAVIDPERAYVGAEPPTSAAASQVIDRMAIANAPWAQTPLIHLNPGLVAVIGARGSGKTALVDMIAASCDAYHHSERPSFLARAAEHLVGAAVTLAWKSGDPATCSLDAPVNDGPDAYPRARYLSQQFVEELCSVARDVRDSGDSPYDLAINSVRGEAMIAMCRYAVWIKAALEREGHVTSVSSMPEVEGCLSGHFDRSREPSPAVFAVMGETFQVFHWIDRAWGERIAPAVFPNGSQDSQLWSAAATTYLRFREPHPDMLPLLRPLYERGIDELLEPNGTSRPGPGSSQAGLVEHLTAFYAWGLPGAEQLLERFFEVATPEWRAWAIESVGRNLTRGPESEHLSEDVAERLRALWDRRFVHARSDGSRAELEAFGWWVSSGQFGPDWALSRALEVLKSGVSLEPDHLLVDYLLTVVADRAGAVASVLEGIVDNLQDSWTLHGWRKRGRVLLQRLLGSNDVAAVDTARRTINRLEARGYGGFADLL